MQEMIRDELPRLDEGPGYIRLENESFKHHSSYRSDVLKYDDPEDVQHHIDRQDHPEGRRFQLKPTPCSCEKVFAHAPCVLCWVCRVMNEQET